MYAERKPSGAEGAIWFSAQITSKQSAWRTMSAKHGFASIVSAGACSNCRWHVWKGKIYG